MYKKIGVILFTFEVQSNLGYLSSILHHPLRSFPEKLKSMIAVCVLCSYVNTSPVYTNKVYVHIIRVTGLVHPSYHVLLPGTSSVHLLPTFLVHPSKCFFHGQLTAHVHLNTSYCPCTSVHVLLTVRVYPTTCCFSGTPSHMLLFRTPNNVLLSRYNQQRVNVQVHPSTCYCLGTPIHVLLSRYTHLRPKCYCPGTPIHVLQSSYTHLSVIVQVQPTTC